MAVTVRDDKGQEVRLEGDWTGRLIGQDFTNGGQIMAWLRPGADGWVEPVASPPEIEAPTRAQQLARESRATPTDIKQIAEGN